MNVSKKSSAPLFGAVGLGVLSSACCTLPFVAVSVGIGGTWATSFSWIEPFRWWILSAALLTLGFAVFKEVQRSRQVDCDCEGGMSPIARRGLLAIAIIMTVGMAISPELLRADDAPVSVSSQGLERVVLAVDGMTCDLCTTTVRMALGDVDGATVVDVTYEPPHATVDFDPSSTDSNQLVAAIEAVGYKASPVWESSDGTD